MFRFDFFFIHRTHLSKRNGTWNKPPTIEGSCPSSFVPTTATIWVITANDLKNISYHSTRSETKQMDSGYRETRQCVVNQSSVKVTESSPLFGWSSFVSSRKLASSSNPPNVCFWIILAAISPACLKFFFSKTTSLVCFLWFRWLPHKKSKMKNERRRNTKLFDRNDMTSKRFRNRVHCTLCKMVT